MATQAKSKSLAPVTVTVTRDRAAQTYQSSITSVGKMPVPAKDLAQSLTVVNEKLIHDQGKDSFKSALENVVGITFEAGEGGRVGDNIQQRNFRAACDIYLDGLHGIAQYNTRRVQCRKRRGAARRGIDAVRPRLDRRHHQSGLQAGALDHRAGSQRDGRHQRLPALSGRLQLQAGRRCGPAPQRHGDQQRRARRQCRRIDSSPGAGAGLPFRHRHSQRIRGQLPPPALQRQAGLGFPVA